MASFLFTYRAPTQYAPGTPEAVAEWKAFFAAMGGHLVAMGEPVFTRETVGATNDTVLGGYSLVDADDLDAALAIAKDCPLVSRGGGVEVGELTSVDEGVSA
ncbi:MAG TPA: YciI family protein [Acidimicrobiia bacterium]|jgi:hypothetical protein